MKKQKKPAQNNHEGCYIPGGMEMYADQPIYHRGAVVPSQKHMGEPK